MGLEASPNLDSIDFGKSEGCWEGKPAQISKLFSCCSQLGYRVRVKGPRQRWEGISAPRVGHNLGEEWNCRRKPQGSENAAYVKLCRASREAPAGTSFLVGFCDQDRLILLLKDVLTSCKARGSRLVEICLVSLKSVAKLALTSLRPPSRQDT